MPNTEALEALQKIYNMAPIHYSGNAFYAFLAVMDLYNKRKNAATIEDIVAAERAVAAAFMKLELGEKEVRNLKPAKDDDDEEDWDSELECESCGQPIGVEQEVCPLCGAKQ